MPSQAVTVSGSGRVPSNKRPRKVIDLTGDGDDDGEKPRPRRLKNENTGQIPSSWRNGGQLGVLIT